MAVPASEAQATRGVLEKVRAYERLRLPTQATVGLAALVLLVHPGHWALWLAVAAVLVSEPRYRKATYHLLGSPSPRRLATATFREIRHQSLLILVVMLSVGTLLLEAFA